MGDNIELEIKLKFKENVNDLMIGLSLYDYYDTQLAHIINHDDNFIINGVKDEIKTLKVKILNLNFSPGNYYFNIWLGNRSDVFDYIKRIKKISIIQSNILKRHTNYPPHIKCFFQSHWEYNV